MKIFNWVHRRFNNKADYAKKNDDICVDDDQFQLENSCNHVFERWGGGILTIGTLGYDPLKDQNEQQNDFFYKEEEEEDDDVDGYDDDGDDDDDETSDSDEELDQVAESEDEEQNPLVLRYNAEVEENWNDDEEQDQLQFGYEYMMMKKQERITLADLFSADSSDKQQQDDDHRIVMKKQSINKKLQPQLLKQKSNRKHALSFANNLTAHKFNQLMRRMLKRKIHPDVGPITSKADEVPAMAPANNKCRTTDDHASLLLTLQEAKI